MRRSRQASATSPKAYCSRYRKPPWISFDDRLEVFYGNVQVLFDVDFEIDEGEIVALLGTNGAGKSTLLRAICGVVEADKGAVIFDGRDITHAPPNEIAAFGITQVPGTQ